MISILAVPSREDRNRRPVKGEAGLAVSLGCRFGRAVEMTLRRGLRAYKVIMIPACVAILIASAGTCRAQTASDKGGSTPRAPICAGDQVADFEHGPGKVLEIFSNDKARVRFYGWTNDQYVDLATIGKETACFEGVCKGARVAHASRRVIHGIVGDAVLSGGGAGKVESVYENGLAFVEFDHPSVERIVWARELGSRVETCLHGACVDDRVLDPKFGVGTIVEVFTNVARIDFDGYVYSQYRRFDELVIAARCAPVRPGCEKR